MDLIICTIGADDVVFWQGRQHVSEFLCSGSTGSRLYYVTFIRHIRHPFQRRRAGAVATCLELRNHQCRTECVVQSISQAHQPSAARQGRGCGGNHAESVKLAARANI